MLKEKFPSGVLPLLLAVLLFMWQAVKNWEESEPTSEIRLQCLNFGHNVWFIVLLSHRCGKIVSCQ